MKTYKQRVKFEKTFEIQARDASQANEKLCALVHEAEWSADVQSEGFYEFEDEPVECPECKGNGEIDDERTCSRCNGTVVS